MLNAGVSLSVLVIVLTGLRVQGLAVARGWVPVAASRKSAHVLLGSLVLLSWPVYDDSVSARWYAALPLFVLILYFGALGLGVIRDERTVAGASRSGHRSEMLTGPVLYCAAVAPLTVLFWRSPVSVAAFAVLIFGDGLGEIVGTRVRSPRLPWNRRKSIAGTAAVLLGGWIGAWAVSALFAGLGFLAVASGVAPLPLLVVAAVGALVESATPGALDNLTVVLAAGLAASIVL